MPPSPRALLLVDPSRTSSDVTLLTAAAARADDSRGDPVRAALLARSLGERLPVPGSGSTLALWETLATLGATDLTVARVVEPHLDALAILDQDGAGDDDADRTSRQALWGVYAAEGPPPRLEA